MKYDRDAVNLSGYRYFHLQLQFRRSSITVWEEARDWNPSVHSEINLRGELVAAIFLDFLRRRTFYESPDHEITCRIEIKPIMFPVKMFYGDINGLLSRIWIGNILLRSSSLTTEAITGYIEYLTLHIVNPRKMLEIISSLTKIGKKWDYLSELGHLPCVGSCEVRNQIYSNHASTEMYSDRNVFLYFMNITRQEKRKRERERDRVYFVWKYEIRENERKGVNELLEAKYRESLRRNTLLLLSNITIWCNNERNVDGFEIAAAENVLMVSRIVKP